MISVIIPVYNEQNAILDTVQSLLNTLTHPVFENCFEIIVVNDGSTDDTSKRLKTIDSPNVKIINKRLNQGYGSAIKTGMRFTNYDNIAITDADQTYPNDMLPELFQFYIAEELDMAIGARKVDHGSFFILRSLVKSFLRKFASYITSYPIPDLNSGFRIFKKEIAFKYYSMYPDGFSFTTTITMAMISDTYRVDYYPIEYYKREGNSKIRPVRDSFNFIFLITKMCLYYRPLMVFFPIVVISGGTFLVSVSLDIVQDQNIHDRTILVGMISGIILSLGLLADLIAKKH
ncbi:MAG: glycosyltransferase family 2 protein [Bacteriovoracaceae bacterium]|nr:glycosyltransferase family 2 protein [Bacteriovoracaceae bacterium]